MADRKMEIDEMISLCISGDSRAHSVLYSNYKGIVYSIALKYSKNKDEAEDISQDVFIKIFGGIKNFRGDGSFDGWIRRIAVNTSINYYRKKVQNGYHYDVDNMWDLKDDSYERMSPSVTREDMEKILEKMPEGYANCIKLHILDGYKHKEISEMLGVDINTSKSQLSRGRTMLLKIMETYFN